MIYKSKTQLLFKNAENDEPIKAHMPSWANNPDYTSHATTTKPDDKHRKGIFEVFDTENVQKTQNTNNDNESKSKPSSPTSDIERTTRF